MIDLSLILTGIIISLGVALVMPAYYQHKYQQLMVIKPLPSTPPSNPLLLAFSIVDEKNLPNWCTDLFSFIKNQNLKATLFIAGKVAEKFPDCVTNFSSYGYRVDIGSLTYNYVNLTSIPDHMRQLQEIQKGKATIDKIANVNSTLFKAPYGSTDPNIYSLLTRSGIIADFSYPQQYNKYENGQFTNYNLVAFNGSNYKSKDLFNHIISNQIPGMLNFDNSVPVDNINKLITKIKKANKNSFITPSELTSLALTQRQ
jgi:hypothetical protein